MYGTHGYEKAILPTKPGSLFKNQNPRNSVPPDITFPALGHNHTLCPVTAIKLYQEKTHSLPHNNFLFVHPISGQPLIAGRLSYWLARAINTGDSNTIRATGHDTQKFSHSIAHFRRVDAEVLHNSFWHSRYVFVLNYLVPCRPTTSNFAAGRAIN